jgi:hypothetical protein
LRGAVRALALNLQRCAHARVRGVAQW